MDFLLRKGQPFREEFNFKDENGKPRRSPSGTYRLVLERSTFVRVFTEGDGLRVSSSKVIWTIQDTNDFEYNTLYYTLYLDEMELARGVVKVQ